MARGKGKKTPSKGSKRKIFKEENNVSKAPSNGSNNLGPLAGTIAALFILLVAIFWRPTNETPTSSTYQSADATVENVTMEASNEVPVNESAKVEKEPEIETPVQPESTPGFYMNAFHDIDTFPPNKEDLLHYLKYDDGYAVCLRKEDLQDLDEYGVWDLKKTKLQYLEYIANDEAHWIAESPLTRHATCRILTLIHDDYDAVNKFRNVMQRGNKDEIVNFTLDKVNDASEFRTTVCLSRLADHMVINQEELTPEFQQLKYNWAVDGTAAKEIAEKEKPRLIAHGWTAKSDKASSFHYYVNGPSHSSWIRPTVRPGEMGTVPRGKHEKKASLVVRKNPCPLQNSKPLLESS